MSQDNLADMINAGNTPLAKLLGVQVTFASKEKVEALMTVRDDLCTIPATLHGGAIMAFADNVGAIGAVLNLPPNATTSTIESKTNFIRPVPVGQAINGVATPVNIGKTLQIWKTEIFREDGKLAAVVTQTQIVKMAPS